MSVLPEFPSGRCFSGDYLSRYLIVGTCVSVPAPRRRMARWGCKLGACCPGALKKPSGIIVRSPSGERKKIQHQLGC
ncbi:hypothetical protein NDU88_006159 [Pleurodeles waltl]|uniref:Uncharacterized protein n=1 Tax=Pleurodeles waltl TaxID=8319 RepID=A0AAV7PKA1_PLEWA|nr:hypothetical protein NDU88_006159 [Pleurodeles waltl]